MKIFIYVFLSKHYFLNNVLKKKMGLISLISGTFLRTEVKRSIDRVKALWNERENALLLCANYLSFS